MIGPGTGVRVLARSRRAARLFLDVVRALPADTVGLELRSAEQDLEIVSGSATFHLRTLRLDDFPPLPAPAGQLGDVRFFYPAGAVPALLVRAGLAGAALAECAGPVRTGSSVISAGAPFSSCTETSTATNVGPHGAVRAIAFARTIDSSVAPTEIG